MRKAGAAGRELRKYRTFMSDSLRPSAERNLAICLHFLQEVARYASRRCMVCSLITSICHRLVNLQCLTMAAPLGVLLEQGDNLEAVRLALGYG